MSSTFTIDIILERNGMISFLKNIYALWFPQSCVICKKSLTSYANYSLCHSCEQTLYPISEPSCKKCGRPLISELELCMECRTKNHEFNRLVPIFDYRGQIYSVLIAYKGNGLKSLVNFFARCIYDKLCALAWNAYPVVPVPPRKGKLKTQGWDQVALLTTVLERKYKVWIIRALYRKKASIEQKKLNCINRSAAIRGQFSVANKIKNLPETIVLLDDVVTTGATLNECTRVLQAHGCIQIYALAIAID